MLASEDHLTTNQKVGSSNLSGRTRLTSRKSALPLLWSFILFYSNFSRFILFLAHICHTGISLFPLFSQHFVPTSCMSSNNSDHSGFFLRDGLVSEYFWQNLSPNSLTPAPALLASRISDPLELAQPPHGPGKGFEVGVGGVLPRNGIYMHKFRLEWGVILST